MRRRDKEREGAQHQQTESNIANNYQIPWKASSVNILVKHNLPNTVSEMQDIFLCNRECIKKVTHKRRDNINFTLKLACCAACSFHIIFGSDICTLQRNYLLLLVVTEYTEIWLGIGDNFWKCYWAMLCYWEDVTEIEIIIEFHAYFTIATPLYNTILHNIWNCLFPDVKGNTSNCWIN